ncbi:hypothetical protein HID58_032303 [Brassica napus]|uniref:HTH myb-type domain-containing protein n=1 Tax=Brassica napus TaxID=3708 RepID=A0ABQ8BVZ9_BRANA|nr:hypothetical protein HID58_032303 [Brassica napus]
MGAPKQKWTPEEEAALKAGVLKHGTGKWRTILSDPHFSSVLKSRSNVDLKIKHKYRFSTNFTSAGARHKSSQLCIEEGNNNSPRPKGNGANILTKSRADEEVFMIKGMTAKEAAETAARAVAEAEFAITEAEEAAKEADKAEAEAEAAQIYAKAAVKALKFRISNHTW